MNKPYIVAELGCNAGSDMGLLLDMMHSAKETGVNCIKLQCFMAEHLIKNSPLNSNLKNWQIEDWKIIAETANELEIDWFASCFCSHALKKIEKFKPCRWKSAAPSLVEASKWKSKLKWWASYDPRYYLLDSKYNTDLLAKAEVSFLCRSDYPARWQDYNKELIACKTFNGLSDHTPDFELVSRFGWHFDYFEKHFKMDDDCIDDFALNPAQMKQYVELVHLKHGSHDMETDRLKSYQKRFE